MSKELNEIEKTLRKTKKEFLATSKRAAKELERQRKRIRKEITKANNRAKTSRIQLQKKTERLANSTAATVKRELVKQIHSLEKVLDGAKTESAKLRKDMAPVMEDLNNARNHLTHALRLDRAMALIERELAKKLGKKKKVVKKKAKSGKKVAKKKPVTRKKAAKKKVAKKKAGKTATRKKVSKKKAA